MTLPHVLEESERSTPMEEFGVPESAPTRMSSYLVQVTRFPLERAYSPIVAFASRGGYSRSGIPRPRWHSSIQRRGSSLEGEGKAVTSRRHGTLEPSVAIRWRLRRATHVMSSMILTFAIRPRTNTISRTARSFCRCPRLANLEHPGPTIRAHSSEKLSMSSASRLQRREATRRSHHGRLGQTSIPVGR
jgi:hypothetical protein